MLFFIFLFSFLFCQQELIDGVVATVGDKTILFSEVLSETRMLAEQKKISPQTSPLMFQKLFDRILKDKIYLKVVLIEAEKDTLFSVTYDEINTNLNNRIDVFTNQVGSEENLEKAFGMSIGDIKNNYWETVREELLIEKFKFSLLGDLTVSKNEVLSFYEEYKDSIPAFNDKASFSLIQKKIEISLKSENNIKKKLETIKDSINIVTIDTIEHNLADKNGNFLGRKRINIVDNSLFHEENISLDNKKKYFVLIEHAMSAINKVGELELLEGVVDVGFKIEIAK